MSLYLGDEEIALIWESPNRFRDWFRDLEIEIIKNSDPRLVLKQIYIQLLRDTCRNFLSLTFRKTGVHVWKTGSQDLQVNSRFWVKLNYTETSFGCLVTLLSPILILNLKRMFGEEHWRLSPAGCSHASTSHCLPTCLGMMPDDCSNRACSWFSGKPSKIQPYWTEPRKCYWY